MDSDSSLKIQVLLASADEADILLRFADFCDAVEDVPVRIVEFPWDQCVLQQFQPQSARFHLGEVFTGRAQKVPFKSEFLFEILDDRLLEIIDGAPSRLPARQARGWIAPLHFACAFADDGPAVFPLDRNKEGFAAQQFMFALTQP